MQPEIWKDIPGYEGRYQASTEGRIRSLDRITHQIPSNGKQEYDRLKKGKILNSCIGSNGYPYVGLRREQKSDNATWLPVHHLVALTFIGQRPEKTHICHANGNKEDNRVENLRYDTPTENGRDVYRYGKCSGKLSIDQAKEIKVLLAEGILSKSEIGRRYGVSKTAIYYIATGEHFGWLT